MRHARRSHKYPSNVRKVAIGYEAIGRVRTHNEWRSLRAWALTPNGARRRLDRMISEVMQYGW